MVDFIDFDLLEEKEYKFEENIIKFELLNLEKGKSVWLEYISGESIKSLINNSDNNNNDKEIKKLKELFDKYQFHMIFQQSGLKI